MLKYINIFEDLYFLFHQSYDSNSIKIINSCTIDKDF